MARTVRFFKNRMEVYASYSSAQLNYHGPKRDHRYSCLNLSIAKWTAIVQYLEENSQYIEDGGKNTCGLCMLFWDFDGCNGCPIQTETGGRNYCEGNKPFQFYSLEDFYSDEVLDAAKEELKFLKQLKKKYLSQE